MFHGFWHTCFALAAMRKSMKKSPSPVSEPPLTAHVAAYRLPVLQPSDSAQLAAQNRTFCTQSLKRFFASAAQSKNL